MLNIKILGPGCAKCYALDWLVAACLAAGQQQWGKLEELRQAWETFLGLCQEG